MNPTSQPNEALGESEEQLRLALDSAGLGWWHVDLATGDITYNERFRVLAGLHPGEPLDYGNSLKLVHPEDRERIQAAVEAATRAENPQPYDMAYRTLHADGSYHWLHSRGQSFFEGEGASRRAVRFVGTVADIDDRQRAQEALSASENRYRTLVGSIDSGFAVIRMLFDATGHPVDYLFIEVNAAFENQTGLVDSVGKTALELVPGLEQHWFDLYGAVVTTGEPIRFSQGSVAMGRVFSVYAYRMGGEGSHDVALLFNDVTAAHTVEADLRNAHERTTAILETITDGYFTLDEEWVFTYVNPQAERILSRQPGDLIGRSIFDVYEGLETTEFGIAYHAVAQDGQPRSFTAYYPGHDRWYEVHARAAEIGITVYFRDATERMRYDAERERLLKEVEAERSKLELAHAESLAFVAILKGEDLVFDYANDPYYQLVGHREIIGKPLAEALPEVVGQGFPALLRAVMTTGERFEAPEFAVTLQKTPGGPFEERIVTLRYLPINEPDGSISGVYAHGMDVTEMVHARRTLAARAEETAIGSRRKDEFLATLAHELRNPLAPIRLSSELMGILEPNDPEFEEARKIIIRQVDHMARLVDDLLDVSRVAQGKITLQRKPLDLAGVIRAAVETSRPAIETGNHTLTLAYPPETIVVDGDATRLAQVLANLLNNASKYTPTGGEIEITTTREGDEAVMIVRDNGIGIPPEMLPHIFDMFAQAEVHLVQSQGGLGIGLTLSRRLIELHGGTIRARSQGPGHGSEFIVRIPCIEGSIAVAKAIQTTSTGLPNRRVLVVDDNVDGARTLSGLLGTMGHEVRIAHTGADAITVADEFIPEVVLLDLGLPDLPGYQVARQIRADPKLAGAYVVAQTGWGREEDRALGRQAGFDDHLVKPLALADLERLFAKLE